MYFHYPTWFGSMSDPSLVPPPPVVFKPYYFKPEKSTSAKQKKDQYAGSYADDDIGLDYGPEYVRPMPYPPPPNPPKKEGYFDYWTYTRAYNARPYSFGHTHEYPPFPRARPYGYASSAYDYRYTHSHSHTHSHPHSHTHPHPHPHPRPQASAPHSKHTRTSWSTQDATRAWRAKQETIWEDWGQAAEDIPGWGKQAPPSPKPRPPESNDQWPNDWDLPRSPSPPRSDSGWHEGARYSNSYRSWEWDWSTIPETLLRSRSSSPSETRLSEAFASYSKIWETLLSPDNSKSLLFRNIPWPQYPSPRSVEDIDAQNVRAFLMAGGRPLKACLREALLRFHPDKTALLLTHVAEKDRADVTAGCEAVTRCLSQLMKSATL